MYIKVIKQDNNCTIGNDQNGGWIVMQGLPPSVAIGDIFYGDMIEYAEDQFVFTASRRVLADEITYQCLEFNTL